MKRHKKINEDKGILVCVEEHELKKISEKYSINTLGPINRNVEEWNGLYDLIVFIRIKGNRFISYTAPITWMSKLPDRKAKMIIGDIKKCNPIPIGDLRFANTGNPVHKSHHGWDLVDIPK